MKKNTIVIIVLSIIIVILLNYIILSTALKTSIVEFLKLPVLGSIIVALVSIITVYLTNSFNLKKVKLETANVIHRVQFEKEFNIYIEIWDYVNKIFQIIVEIKSLLKKESDIEPHIDELFNLTSEFNKIINSNTPFYLQDLYTILKYFSLSSSNAISFIIEGNFNKEKFDIYENYIVKLENFVDTIEEVIRLRIKMLKVID